MATLHPVWASDKQKEGMTLFNEIANEYGSFAVSFKQSMWADEDNVFIAVLDWENCIGKGVGARRHEFKIGWNYQDTWDQLGERVDRWQFIFGDDGECTRSVSTECFFIDLFFYMDKNGSIEQALKQD
jgi:hypothetical protein